MPRVAWIHLLALHRATSKTPSCAWEHWPNTCQLWEPGWVFKDKHSAQKSASQPSFGRITRPFLQDFFPSVLITPQTPTRVTNGPLKLKCSCISLYTTAKSLMLSGGSQSHTWSWFRKAPLTLPGLLEPLRATATAVADSGHPESLNSWSGPVGTILFTWLLLT